MLEVKELCQFNSPPEAMDYYCLFAESAIRIIQARRTERSLLNNQYLDFLDFVKSGLEDKLVFLFIQ